MIRRPLARSLEKDHRAIHRIGQSASQHELTTRDGLLAML